MYKQMATLLRRADGTTLLLDCVLVLLRTHREMQSAPASSFDNVLTGCHCALLALFEMARLDLNAVQQVATQRKVQLLYCDYRCTLCHPIVNFLLFS